MIVDSLKRLFLHLSSQNVILLVLVEIRSSVFHWANWKKRTLATNSIAKFDANISSNLRK